MDRKATIRLEGTKHDVKQASLGLIRESGGEFEIPWDVAGLMFAKAVRKDLREYLAPDGARQAAVRREISATLRELAALLEEPVI
jgi:hypothetical protein